MKRRIDLRSDTVTTPTPEMRRAMAEAEVGDDVYREDPTINRLQEQAAEMFGKEAALFLPTGTMANQIAIRLHARPGSEVIVESRSHVYSWEMAAMAALSGCQARPVAAPRGQLTWELIETGVAPDAYYRAPTALVVLENTHGMAGGTVMNVQQSRELIAQIHGQALPVHLDGARIFNAAAALGVKVAELAAEAESVMFSLSKGLCAPVGSMLLGSRSFIEAAWRVRKMFGGGMRQGGVLAAAGLIAIEQMPERLHEDHENARRLAEGLAGLKSFRIDLSTVETNIVVAELEGVRTSDLLRQLSGEGIQIGPIGPGQVRFVTHKDVSREDVDFVLEVCSRV